MIKKNKISTILGIVVLLVGVFAGVFLLNMRQVFRIGASAGSEPKNIRISNITDTSATISWTTDKETANFISWGTSQGSLNQINKEDQNDVKFSTHSITISGLQASTNYFYKINSDGNNFDNGGIPWQFTTGPNIGQAQASTLISGSVINASGKPVDRALVYINVGGYLASTLTSVGGNFVLQLGSIRTTDMSSYLKIDPNQTLLQISILSSADGVSSAQIFSGAAKSIPPIVIGQTYDFRSLSSSQDGQTPSADINLPQNTTISSKFNVSSPSGTPQPTSVILESLNQGETITTTKPEFFGKGPAGEDITITVHSESPVSTNLSIPNSGSWNWSVPNDLAAGAHSITISWIDASGITRTLTRDFVVQASEAPAFTASESGTINSPSPTPAGSPNPTLTPSPTASATAQPVPVTGDLTPTLLLFIMGVVVLIFSFMAWKLADN